MKEQKNKSLFFLGCAAVISITTFSGIGIAAITGHLPVGRGHLDPFFAFDQAREEGPRLIVPPTPLGPMHAGLMQQSESQRATRPFELRKGQRLAKRGTICATCGVVNSIEPRNAPAESDSADASGMSGQATMEAGDGRFAGFAVPSALQGSKGESYVVRVRMENGTVRTIYENQRPVFSVGERVKFVNGSLASES
jgi:hypothetical protein